MIQLYIIEKKHSIALKLEILNRISFYFNITFNTYTL